MTLGNWGHCIHDCRKAISHAHEPLKPYWRGAKAALKLRKHSHCVKFAAAGLSLHPENKDLTAFKAKAETELAAEKAEKARTNAIKLERVRLTPTAPHCNAHR